MKGLEDSDGERIRIAFLEKTLDYCAVDYAVLERGFANLDTKAQATFAVAGIFVAVLGSFLGSRELIVTIKGSYVTTTLFLVTLLALVGSTILSLVAMRIRVVPSPLEGEALSEVVADLLPSDDSKFSRETYEGWFRERIDAWDEPLKGMRAVNDEKATWVLRGQWVLMVAIGSSALMAMSFLAIA